MTHVDLNSCDREPIHIPGQIQPYGFLLVLTREFQVISASENAGEFLGIPQEQLVGATLDKFFSLRALKTIRGRMVMLRSPDAVERIFGLEIVAGRGWFDVAVHFSGDNVILDAEPNTPEDELNGIRLRARDAHTAAPHRDL
jgi:light-regulated signal transduction histidine kinase (bacteriophytochrome)